uniref:Uncharacterized protein n=1 Tax=Rhizophora mucronata TaxID=61149 RepID=A0A2P2NGA3_RHIMU
MVKVLIVQQGMPGNYSSQPELKHSLLMIAQALSC